MFEQINYSHHTRHLPHLEIKLMWEIPVRGIARSIAILKPVDVCVITEQHAAFDVLLSMFGWTERL